MIRASTLVCCLTAALAGALQGQQVPPRFPRPLRTPTGVDVAPGIGLTRNATVYLDGISRSRLADRSVVRVAWSPLDGAAIDLLTPSIRLSDRAAVHLRASMAATRRFASPDGGPATTGAAVALSGRQISVEPLLTLATPLQPVQLSAGPVFEYTTLTPSLAPAASRLGAQARLEAVWGSPALGHAFAASVGGVWYAPVMGLARSVSVGRAEARALVTLPVPLEPALLVRGGVVRAWGPTDLYTAAYLGGDATFRGAATARYAGTLASYAGAELRLPLARVQLLGDAAVGVLGFVDAGRSWTRAGFSTQWLTAAGGGVWIRPGSSHRTFSAGVGGGPDGPRFYLRTDIGF